MTGLMAAVRDAKPVVAIPAPEPSAHREKYKNAFYKVRLPYSHTIRRTPWT
jgi:hypothetical protein